MKENNQSSITEKLFDKIDRFKEEKTFNKYREEFLKSEKSIKTANSEVKKLFESLQNTFDLVREKRLPLKIYADDVEDYRVIAGQGFSFGVTWEQQSSNSLHGSKLCIHYFRGHHHPIQGYLFPEYPTDITKENVFSFDVDKEFDPCWMRKSDNKQYGSEQIVNDCFEWLIDEITKR